ncbi:HAD family hydrolase [Candidatus Puniceispirillum sp.]|nr:HAD family hydrolase [Candidatus Puniceispirillum sp.]
MSRKPAIFLDRDNTLIHDDGYIFEIKKFSWIDGASAALKRFHDAHIPVFIVTNQGGIGRGFFSENQMHQFNDHLIANASNAGGFITDIAFCPHHPLSPDPEMAAACRCRKPEPGLFFDLAQKWQIDLATSVMIGDRDSDVKAGERAGMHTYLFTKNNLDDLAKQVVSSHFL